MSGDTREAVPSVIANVRRALGRDRPLSRSPVPPPIHEPVVRLVHSDIGLGELFRRNAAAMGIEAHPMRIDDLGRELGAFLHEASCHRIAVADSEFLRGTQIETSLKRQGFEVRRWDSLGVDDLYDFDAGVTDVYGAVAETGSLVVRAESGHGRTLSLTPPVHVAIVRPQDLLPDLVDLFNKLDVEGTHGGTVLITGPSKTSDIEMNLVVGVHGPMRVRAYVLE